MLFAVLAITSNHFTQLRRLSRDAAELERGQPPIESYIDGWQDAAKLYAEATVRYGARSAFAGLARCDLRLERDREALVSATRAYRSDLAQIAESRLRIRHLASWHLIKPEQILAVRPLVNGDWVVLTGESATMPDGGPKYYGALRLRRADSEGALLGAATEIDVDGGTIDVSLDIWRDGTGRQNVIFTHCILSEGCVPGDLVAYRWEGNHFTKKLFLPMKYGIKAWPDQKRLVVSISPTYKVSWADVYEWDGTNLAFANAKHPAFFHGPVGDILNPHHGTNASVYESWLTEGCMYACRHDWKHAKRDFRRAELTCLKNKQDEDDGAYGGHGPYGKPEHALPEIRQRLRRIQNHDYNHALLYRPYDFDLQVQPYKFGHAGDDR